MDKHKHEKGDLVSQFFVGRINSDLTEGRGPMVDHGIYEDKDVAYQGIKGMATMGCGDGDIVIRTYHRCLTCPEIIKTDTTIYYGDNYTKKHNLGGLTGRYKDFMPDGWRKDYSPLPVDPEWEIYLRLKEKFG